MIERLLVIVATIFVLNHTRGTLTLVIRAGDGQPAANVEIALWEDQDVDGRTLVTTRRSDIDGRIVLTELPHANYAIEFLGRWQGEPLQAAEEQNRGPLDDTAGVRGFGLRFSEPELTRLFVLSHTDIGVVPHWDEATTVDEAPRPLLLPSVPLHPSKEAYPAPTALVAEVILDGQSKGGFASKHVAASTPNRWWILPLGCGLLGGSLLLIDWYQRRRRPAAFTPDGDFDA